MNKNSIFAYLFLISMGGGLLHADVVNPRMYEEVMDQVNRQRENRLKEMREILKRDAHRKQRKHEGFRLLASRKESCTDLYDSMTPEEIERAKIIYIKDSLKYFKNGQEVHLIGIDMFRSLLDVDNLKAVNLDFLVPAEDLYAEAIQEGARDMLVTGEMSWMSGHEEFLQALIKCMEESKGKEGPDRAVSNASCMAAYLEGLYKILYDEDPLVEIEKREKEAKTQN